MSFQSLQDRLDDLQLWFAERRPRVDRRRSSSGGHGPRLDALRDRGDDLRARWAGLPDRGRVMVASSGLASMAMAAVATLVVLSGSSWPPPATPTTDVRVEPSPTGTLPPVEADGEALPPAIEPPAEPPAAPPLPGDPPLPADPATPGPSDPAGVGASPDSADRPSFGGLPGDGGGPGPVGPQPQPQPPPGTGPPAPSPPPPGTGPPAPPPSATTAPPTTARPPKPTTSTTGSAVCNGSVIRGVCVPTTRPGPPSTTTPP